MSTNHKNNQNTKASNIVMAMNIVDENDTKKCNSLNKLFTENVVLMYFSKSKDSIPGKGTGERLILNTEEDCDNIKQSGPFTASELSKETLSLQSPPPPPPPFQFGDLQALSKIKDWRKLLSNFCESPFELDGYNWRSVEHYFQAQKFKTKAPWHYRSFTMDSNSELSKQLGGPVKKAGGKSVIELSKLERVEWEKVKHSEMQRALYAKYSQNDNLCQLLLSTGNAKLTHKPSRCKFTFVEYDLMLVRRRLQEEKGLIIAKKEPPKNKVRQDNTDGSKKQNKNNNEGKKAHSAQKDTGGTISLRKKPSEEKMQVSKGLTKSDPFARLLGGGKISNKAVMQRQGTKMNGESSREPTVIRNSTTNNGPRKRPSSPEQKKKEVHQNHQTAKKRKTLDNSGGDEKVIPFSSSVPRKHDKSKTPLLAASSTRTASGPTNLAAPASGNTKRGGNFLSSIIGRVKTQEGKHPV